MRMTNRITVQPKWDTFTYPIKRGTPLNLTGQLANNADAVGIVPETIEKKPYFVQYLSIMTGGTADLSEIAYTDLSVAAMRAMNGIKFYSTDGTPAADPVYEVPTYTLPTASADTLGGVKVGTGLAIASGVLSVKTATASAIGAVKMAANVAAAAGEAPTAAEFKALLDALKAAGIMVADAES